MNVECGELHMRVYNVIINPSEMSLTVQQYCYNRQCSLSTIEHILVEMRALKLQGRQHVDVAF